MKGTDCEIVAANEKDVNGNIHARAMNQNSMLIQWE